MHLELDGVAPETLAFGLLVGISVGYTGGAVAAGRALSEYLLLLPVLLGAGVAVYTSRMHQ